MITKRFTIEITARFGSGLQYLTLSRVLRDILFAWMRWSDQHHRKNRIEMSISEVVVPG